MEVDIYVVFSENVKGDSLIDLKVFTSREEAKAYMRTSTDPVRRGAKNQMDLIRVRRKRK